MPLPADHTAGQFITAAAINAIELAVNLNELNIASIVIPKPPYEFGAATATIGVTGSARIHTAGVLTGLRVRVATAPAGSALTVQLQRSTNGGGTWVNVGGTASVVNGSTAEATVAFSQSAAANDLIRLNATSVGATTAAAGVAVEATWT